MKLPASLRALTRVQWLSLSLLFLGGLLLWVIPGAHPSGLLGSTTKEAGVVTIGTVFVALIYEYLLRPEQDRKMTAALERGLFGRASVDGLLGIEEVSCERVIGSLGPGDELLWLDTFPRNLDQREWQVALREAVERGASIRLVVSDLHGTDLKARAQQITAHGYGPEELPDRARTTLRTLSRIQSELAHTDIDRLSVRQCPDCVQVPMYLVCHGGVPREAWTSYFLSDPTSDSTHLHWGQPRGGTDSSVLGVAAFSSHFASVWEKCVRFDLDADSATPVNNTSAVGRGYCSPEFFAERAQQATTKLDLLLHRNLNLATENVMGALRAACERGVVIRVLSFSSCADDVLLAEAIRIIPQPVPTTVDKLHATLQHGETFVAESLSKWSVDARRRFEYRHYTTMPNAHAFFTDTHVYTGFRHVWTDEERQYSRNELYQCFPNDSPVSRILSSHFKALWSQADPVSPEGPLAAGAE